MGKMITKIMLGSQTGAANTALNFARKTGYPLENHIPLTTAKKVTIQRKFFIRFWPVHLAAVAVSDSSPARGLGLVPSLLR